MLNGTPILRSIGALLRLRSLDRRGWHRRLLDPAPAAPSTPRRRHSASPAH